jgi:hypothetical protein
MKSAAVQSRAWSPCRNCVRHTLPLMPSHRSGSPLPEKTIEGAIAGRAHACAAMANCVNSNAAAIKQARSRIALLEEPFKVTPPLLRHYNFALIHSTKIGARRVSACRYGPAPVILWSSSADGRWKPANPRAAGDILRAATRPLSRCSKLLDWWARSEPIPLRVP